MPGPSLPEPSTQHHLRDLSDLHGLQPGLLALFSLLVNAKVTGPLLCKTLGAPAGRKKPVLSEWSEGEREKMKGCIPGNL